MIKILQEGKYSLIETKGQVKILTLDNKDTFAWVMVEDIGEILVGSHNEHETDHILAVGDYKIYDVKGEEGIADLPHLELSVGEGKWQGYLLLTGLPTDKDKRKRIIPTKEVIESGNEKE